MGYEDHLLRVIPHIACMGAGMVITFPNLSNVDENKRRKLTFNKGAFYVQSFLSNLPSRNLLVKGKLKIPPLPAR